MSFFSFGRRIETYLTVVTSEGAGKLRLNGVRARNEKSKRDVIAHERTVCWIEFAHDGIRLDQGSGRAAEAAGSEMTARLLREVPASRTCRGVLERLRRGQSSVSKWLELETNARHAGPGHTVAADSRSSGLEVIPNRAEPAQGPSPADVLPRA